MRRFLPIFHRISSRYSNKVLGCLTVVGGGASLAYAYSNVRAHPEFIHQVGSGFPLSVFCATKHIPQTSVINETKNHALYLTIHLNPSADMKDCMKALGLLQKHVDTISPPDLRDETDEIWCGVGFGSGLMSRIKPESQPTGLVPYNYRTRSGPLGDMPNTGGDIFIHAKCNERGKLFELCQAVTRSLPEGSVAKFEDTYGWVYRGGRDLTGFIDGTENPADENDRISVAIDPKSGGSYVIAQKWIHDHKVIQTTKDKVKENWIGRDITDSTELKNKTITSHVSRMVGSAELDAPTKHQIVRHSQPWGSVSGDSGLFFIAYSATPVALDFMLDQMTGLGEDKQSDDVMRLTRCTSGNYWYFPSQSELTKLITNACASKSGRFWR